METTPPSTSIPTPLESISSRDDDVKAQGVKRQKKEKPSILLSETDLQSTPTCQFFLKNKNRICGFAIPAGEADTVPLLCHFHKVSEEKVLCEKCQSYVQKSKYTNHFSKTCPVAKALVRETSRSCFIRGVNTTVNTLPKKEEYLLQNWSETKAECEDTEKLIIQHVPSLLNGIDAMVSPDFKYSQENNPWGTLSFAKVRTPTQVSLDGEQSPIPIIPSSDDIQYWIDQKNLLDEIWKRVAVQYLSQHPQNPQNTFENGHSEHILDLEARAEKIVSADVFLNTDETGLEGDEPQVLFSIPPTASSLLENTVSLPTDSSESTSEISEVLDISKSTSPQVSSKKDKHMVQHSALLKCLDLAGVTNECLSSNPSSSTKSPLDFADHQRSLGIVELGAGKAGLLLAIAEHHRKIIENEPSREHRFAEAYFAVDSQLFRTSHDSAITKVISKLEGKTQIEIDSSSSSSPLFSRIRSDIRDFSLDQLQIDANPHSNSQLVTKALVVGKHLCGGATDSSLRCVVNARGGLSSIRAKAIASAKVSAKETEIALETEELVRRTNDFDPERKARILQNQSKIWTQELQSVKSAFEKESITRKPNSVDVFGLSIATCCHHRCDMDSYSAGEILQHWQVTPALFSLMVKWSSWWTSHEFEDLPRNGSSDLGDLGDLDDVNCPSNRSDGYIQAQPWEGPSSSNGVDGYRGFTQSLSATERATLGRKSKLLLDLGRAVFLYQSISILQQDITNQPIVQLLRFTSPDVTRENVTLMARLPPPTPSTLDNN